MVGGCILGVSWCERESWSVASGNIIWRDPVQVDLGHRKAGRGTETGPTPGSKAPVTMTQQRDPPHVGVSYHPEPTPLLHISNLAGIQSARWREIFRLRFDH